MLNIGSRSDVELEGVTYRIAQLDTFKQMHVYRRLIPLLTPFINQMIKRKDQLLMSFIKKTEAPDAEKNVLIDDIEDREVFLMGLVEMANAIAKMSDADFDFVVKTCLTVCTKKGADDNWSPIMSPVGSLMFHDIMAGSIIYLTACTILEQHGMMAFIKKLLAGDGPAAQSPAKTPGST